MPAAVPFIPLMAQGVGMIGGAIAGRHATKAAMKRSPEEELALKGAQGSAGQLGKTGGEMLQQSQPWMQQPANYYQTLLSGNRAAMSNAVAAPMAQISQQFRGAERGLDRAGIRGAAKDVAASDLGRERASAMSGLTTGIAPAAAQGLAGLGATSAQLGAGMAGQSGNIYSNLLGQGAGNREYAREEGGKTAAAIGDLAATAGNVLTGVFGGGQTAAQKAGAYTPGKGKGYASTINPGITTTMRPSSFPPVYTGDAFKGGSPWA